MNSPDIDEQAEPLIRGALERVEIAEHDLVLAFSCVRRIDPAALRQMEQLAAKGRERSVKVVLQGVNIEVYKVLKLMAMTRQFTFTV